MIFYWLFFIHINNFFPLVVMLRGSTKSNLFWFVEKQTHFSTS